MSDWVCDASPLIVLAKAGLLPLLACRCERVLTPEAVVEEILAGPASDPTRQALAECHWLVRVSLESPLSPLSTWALDRGEAEVIEYARLHGNLPVMLDDRKARRVAERLGLAVYGTVGLAAAATGKGQVDLFRTRVQALREAGLYVSDRIVEALARELQ